MRNSKLLKATKKLPDTIIKIDEFIDVKGMKSQGNQMTKLKVKEIVVNVPEEGEEPWPQPEKEAEKIAVEEDSPAQTAEWDIAKNEGEEDQAKLF